MAAKTTNPTDMLMLWDVFGPVVVTTHGVCLWGMKLSGLDSEHMPANRLLGSAEILYRDLACQIPEHAFLQFVLDSHSDYSDVFERFDRVDKPNDSVLALQRQRRLEHLKGSNLRRHSLYLFAGLQNGFCKKEFRNISKDMHTRRMRELDNLVARVKGTLECADISCQDLCEDEVLDLFFKHLNPGKDRPACGRARQVYPSDLLRKDKRLRVQTIREYLVQSEMSWSKDCIGIGDQYCSVLTLRDLPPHTEFADPELYYSLDFDFLLSANVYIPPQQKYMAALDQRRRIAKADSGRGGNIEDYKRTGKVREGEELAALISETGQRLVLMAVQAVIKAPTKRLLERRTREFQDRLRSKGYGFFQEKAAHDREFFKTLPGGAVATERQVLVTSNNAVDCLPVFQEDHGDKDPVMLVKTGRGELFSFNPFEESRDNWNATIFGASGSGKSVFVNLMIATSILSNKTKGRLIVVDFAGPQKSSYLMLGRLFGGTYVPVLSGEHALNPFPPPSRAMDKEGRVRSQTEAFLTVLTDMLLSNKGKEKEHQLFRHLVQRGIRDTYKMCGEETPIYSDLYETLKSYTGDAGVDQARLKLVLELMDGFLKSPDSRLFNRRGGATPQSPFLILDLYGVDSLDPHVAQAVTFLTTQWVKELAFDDSDLGNKYVILDEVAQLIRRKEMVNLLDELYSTSRKHRTSVWTVTQSYQTYRQSALADTIKLNSTTQIFLSHASDEVGRRHIADDYQFARREKHLFDQLRTVKGKYSTALIRTEVADEDRRDKHYLTSVLKIELSPFDYQICTSDAADRELQRKYIEANKDRPLHEVLEYIAGKQEWRAA